MDTRLLARCFALGLTTLTLVSSGAAIAGNAQATPSPRPAVAGASEIDVLLADGNHEKGMLVGRDPKTNLAVIRIAARPGSPASRTPPWPCRPRPGSGLVSMCAC